MNDFADLRLVASQSAAGAGVFELQILEFSNYRLQLASGACCAGARRAAAACSQPCRTRFALCLKEYQSAAAPGACSFGRAASPVLGTDSFTLAEPLYTLSLPFSFRWTVSAAGLSIALFPIRLCCRSTDTPFVRSALSRSFFKLTTTTTTRIQVRGSQ